MGLLPTARSNSGATRDYESPIVPVGTTVVLGTPELTMSIDAPHNFGGVELFNDAAGSTPATATAGTFTMQVKTFLNPQGLDAISGGEIDATALTTPSWDAPTIGVTVTPAGVTGATHYRVNVIQRTR